LVIKLKNQHSPVAVISLFISITYAVHFFKTQEPLYRKFIQSGGKKGNLLTPFSVILISVAFVLAIIFGLDALAAKNFGRGVSLMQQGQYEKAEEIFKSYLQYDEMAYEAYFNLAVIYLETGRPDMAETCIKKYLRYNPDDNLALELLAEIKSAR
jgi:tetratricopeptide (TPR) repeat protein